MSRMKIDGSGQPISDLLNVKEAASYLRVSVSL
jgi:hypothetical protein